ncbi:hypothetical protein UMZ34_05475 [Halopseudomonas pachastrellae]|nr:hypothetical protein UMZ34_05475 [Halopseudomonas pachastrellae]
MNWREVRDATNVRYLLRTARNLGLSVEACLQGSGLDEAMLGAGGECGFSAGRSWRSSAIWWRCTQNRGWVFGSAGATS